MKFWKFEYEGPDALQRCIGNGSLPSSGTKFPGLKDTNDHPRRSMKVGDGVILATLHGEQGKISAIGKVRSIEGSEPSIQWVVMSTTVFPDAKGGLVNWQTKTAFEISPEPAKKYNLKKLVDYYVPDAT